MRQPQPRSARDAVRAAAEDLALHGVPSPRVDAEHLVAHALGVTRSELFADGRALTSDEERRLRALVERRRAREPLQYIVGEWGFRGLTLKVDRRALIPRPETEVVVECCLERLRRLAEPRVVDVGTGSGAIALALAHEHPGARVTAVDRSPDALELARENAERARLATRVELVESDLLANVEGPFDLVVSNPPYVNPQELATLEPELEFEPRAALLDTGATDEIARQARAVLRDGGSLVLECADGRTDRIANLLDELAYEDVTVEPDLAGVARVVAGTFRR